MIPLFYSPILNCRSTPRDGGDETHVPLSTLVTLDRNAIAAVRARYNEASQVRRKMAAEDRWKMFKLIMLGKRHMPFIIAQVFFNIASGSIQTMYRWQNAEVINFFTDRQADGTVNLDGFGNILCEPCTSLLCPCPYESVIDASGLRTGRRDGLAGERESWRGL